MPATLDAYIFYPGSCREAMNFYQSVFGGEVSFMDIKDVPGKVMHGHLTGGLINLMGSDGDGVRTEAYSQGAITLSITSPDEASMRDAFTKLSEGATKVEEIRLEFWGDLFGGLTDKCGIDWIFTIPKPAAE